MKALQKEANIIFWILCKALCWYSHLKEIHFPLSFCCWTYRDFDRYELYHTNSILTWIIQNFQRELMVMAYRKAEPAVPSLAIVLPLCFLQLISGGNFVTEQHLCLGNWKTNRRTKDHKDCLRLPCSTPSSDYEMDSTSFLSIKI